MHSHGNAVDLGGQLPCLAMLSRALSCNVVAWDYRGYGCSGGIPRASKLESDAAAVLAHVKRARGLEDGDVLLYGQSLGSAPACALGAAHARLAGVVLHSALLSGMRTLSPSVRWWPRWADVAVNDALVPKIAAPLLVLHGTADRVVPWQHGCALAALARSPAETLWAQGRGHDDVEADKRYLDTLVRFAERCWGGKR
ncbi:hypothetical protein H632_c325p0 [Helicosporidium sp. ATCC 50920]|nr:hypothetical protein H632_c325p0 [Helicosporidium sp. ATCC 50920]|eukprot:KDD76179.1 hypothetical protein H632_c325p0 [Helicosporidium sp. ATCC 50920]